MRLDFGLTRSVLYDFCFWYCIEGSSVHHEVTDGFTGVYDLNQYVPEEDIFGPSPNDHYFSGYTLARKISMEKPGWSEWEPTSL